MFKIRLGTRHFSDQINSDNDGLGFYFFKIFFFNYILNIRNTHLVLGLVLIFRFRKIETVQIFVNFGPVSFLFFVRFSGFVFLIVCLTYDYKL